jgi:hypothetical protein
MHTHTHRNIHTITRIIPLGYMHARVRSCVGTHKYAKMGSESTQDGG